MGRRIFASVITLLAAFVLQVGVAPYIAIGGVSPNFFLIATIGIALVNGPNEGAGVGFVGGVLFDLVGAQTVGPMALVLAVAGYTAGLLNQNMMGEGWVLPTMTLGLTGLVSSILYQGIVSVLGTGVEFWRTLATLTLPGVVYTTFVGLFFYPPLTRILSTHRSTAAFRRLG